MGPSSSGMPARFGHTAVVIGDVMYVHGGYVAAGDSPGLSDQLWSFDFVSSSWTLVGPRDSNFDEAGTTPYVADPADAIQFPSDIPDARFSHVALAVGDGFFIFGGAGGTTMKEPLDDLWFFNPVDKIWSAVYDDTGLGRYDSACAAMVGPYMVLFGGHGDTGFLSDTQLCFAGLQGFS